MNVRQKVLQKRIHWVDVDRIAEYVAHQDALLHVPEFVKGIAIMEIASEATKANRINHMYLEAS